MDAPVPPRRPWLLIASALVLAGVLAYVLFAGYIPSRQRMAGLEMEIKEVYQKEAELQTQLAQALQKNTLLQQQLIALTAERAALVRRTEELEQELTALKKRRR